MRWVLAMILAFAVVACGSEDSGKDISDEDLQGALLVLDDLPSGWSIDPDEEEADDEDDDAASEICGMPPLSDEIEADAEAERSFTGGDTGPFFRQALAAMDEDEAERGLEYIRDAFGCSEWTDEGSDMTWSLSEISFPDLGDDTAAYRMSTSASGFTFNGDVVVVREGGVVLVAMHMQLGDVDSELTEELVRKAFDKMEDI